MVKLTHLNKIGACYCTDVDVDYAPDGQFKFDGELSEGGGVLYTLN